MRPAKLADVTALVELSDHAYAASKYGEIASLDAARCRLSWQRAITMRETPVFVHEGDGVDGVIVGYASPLEFALDATLVTDVFWYVKPGSNGRAGLGLLKALEDWAAASFGDKAIVRATVTNAVKDPDLACKLLKRKGYSVAGYILERK